MLNCIQSVRNNWKKKKWFKGQNFPPHPPILAYIINVELTENVISNLQNILEKPLEKKAGKNYGPPGTKKLIYFVDDMNMPEVDKYFTVQPHTLVRACLDYGHWYDRHKLTLKEIQKTQFVSCMNPTAGSFTIDSRLQRHFCVFALR